ncbi:unnamed protein product, partial [Thlaspi arvense]
MRLGHMETQPPKIYGTKVRMSVWQLKTQKDAGEFSLGQFWLVSGSYNAGDLNSIEAGWQVYPHIYMDNQPREMHTRSINITISLFRINPDQPKSSYWGCYFSNDSKLRLWWLGVGFSNCTIVEAVGYWPTEIFTRLIEYAEEVQWCGEITNGNISGQHTTTHMGSGYFPDIGFCTATYMCDLEIAANIGDFQPVYDLRFRATNPKYYNVKKVNDTCFFFGGSEHARGVSLRVKLVILHFTFLFYFLACII